MSSYNPLSGQKDTVHTIQRMIDDAALPPIVKNETTGIASAMGSGGTASDSSEFDSLWSSYEEAVANGNVGWLRGYSLVPVMSAVIGGGETLAAGMFTFDVPNKILGLGNATTFGCSLRIFESGGGGYFGLIAAVGSNNNTYTWPDDFPATTKGLQFSSTGVGSWFTPVINFTDLADVPAAYTGAGLNLVRVNAIETGLEFFINPWTKTGTNLIPTTADDNILLHDGSTIGWGNGNPGTLDIWMKRGAAGRLDLGDTTTAFLFRVWGGASTAYTQMGDKFSVIATVSTNIVYRTLISTDSFNRWQSDAAGLFSWGAGTGAVDTGLSRISANLLGMSTGDAFRVRAFAEFAEDGAPSSPGAGFIRDYGDTDRRRYSKDSGGKVHDLTCQHKQVWQLCHEDIEEGVSNTSELDISTVTRIRMIAGGIPPAIAGVWTANNTTWTLGTYNVNSSLNSHYLKYAGDYLGQSISNVAVKEGFIGAPFRKWGTGGADTASGYIKMKVRARLGSGNTSGYEGQMRLQIGWVNSSDVNQASSGQSFTVTTTWAEYELIVNNATINSWGADLRWVVSLQGRNTDSGSYPDLKIFQFDIERVTIEQWAY